ncbi:CpsD/CapB family tyrosine-protein kinase [Candidatus Saccharibacteria bacterium]|nr:CpsD/CapB family tyrosine-protein kinase [Candidatus Saccharibacteria bacterium]
MDETQLLKKEKPEKRPKTRRGGVEDLVVATRPKSSVAEAIKSIKTNILFSSVDKELKTILVTSPESGDGKSFIAANLATAFAQDGKKVLIIDGDMRKGRQHEIFGMENDATMGYSNYILKFREAETAGMMSFIQPDVYIKETRVPGVYLLPAGPTPPNPLELISSDNNRKLLESVKSQYDIVIIDCPPALGLSDALVMSKHTDVNVVTVSNAKTRTDQLESVKKNFEKVNSKITGVVINKAKNTKGGYYSSYYADEYYANLNND